MFSQRDPNLLPWRDYNVDIVFECTGKFTSKETAQAHINQGAKKVLISAPGTHVDATIVYGVNEEILKASDLIVSNASCTTNCLAPLAKALHAGVGIQKGLMTTIHAYTNDQMLLDGNHPDLRRARSATQSMIPTKTGAASALGLVIPELKGRLDGFAMRVPVLNVSVVDLTFEASRETSVEEINTIMKAAAANSKHNILQYNDEPLVSIDFNHSSASAVFDSTQTKVIGNLVKVLAWYDNEWGFSNRMLDVAKLMMT
jgi:glyceraldehyde 3-phosphate dehydrogenase